MKKNIEQSVDDTLAFLCQDERAKLAELQVIRTAIAALKAYRGDDVNAGLMNQAQALQSELSLSKSVPSRIQKDTLRILQFLDGAVRGLDEVEDFCRQNGMAISRSTLTARLNYYRNDFGLIDSPDIGRYTLTEHGSDFVHKKTKGENSSKEVSQQSTISDIDGNDGIEM